MKHVTVLSAAILLLFVGLRSYEALQRAQADSARAVPADNEAYPYTGPDFAAFVQESYQEASSGSADDFFGWFDSAYDQCSRKYPGQESLKLRELLEWKREDLRGISDPEARAKAEMELCAWLHRMVKTVIPKFSLDRGFEFYNVVTRGERQCFLQSVLIAGLLQDMDVYAGVAMVYRNIRGTAINNGHAVTLVKLANGKDLIVDASDPEPFARHQGLFARINGYCYLDPVFEGASPTIVAYRTAVGKQKTEPRRVKTLDRDFLHSQFYYYRGERAPGGLLAGKNKTTEGLQDAASYLRKSVELFPQNPLSVFMLGRVNNSLGNTRQAGDLFAEAYHLYSRFGFVPNAPRDAYTRSRG